MGVALAKHSSLSNLKFRCIHHPKAKGPSFVSFLLLTLLPWLLVSNSLNLCIRFSAPSLGAESLQPTVSVGFSPVQYLALLSVGLLPGFQNKCLIPDENKRKFTSLTALGGPSFYQF